MAGNKFMPELHLRKPGFNYNACGPFTKHRERIQKFRETGDLDHIYKSKLEKTCFAHDAGYSDSKYLAKRTISDKVVKVRSNEIAINPEYDGCQRGLASLIYELTRKQDRTKCK